MLFSDRCVDGINVAHNGKTWVTLLRYGIEEVGFNVCRFVDGLFLAAG